jgi:zinc/manganese transport system substrate-binding protein
MAQAAAPIPVVASFSIVADLVREVGGTLVQVTSLVGPDQDAHAYQPRPSDARAVATARVMVINGLGFEGWAERLAQSAGFKGTAVVASRGVKALRAGEAGHGHAGHSHAAGGTAGAVDPHAWQEVANVKLYVGNIRDGLAAADPANAGAYAANANAYLAKLTALDADITAAWAAIPRAARRIVTSHDAFTYYGDAYGVDFAAPQSAISANDPTPREMAALIAQIRKENIRALFLENISAGQVLAQVARETGARIGGRVYSDALSAPGGPAASYAAMMRHNTRLFVEALR